MKVILVGSNPSNASPDTSAFHPDTKSRRFMQPWFEGLDIELSFANVSDQRTPNNRPLRVSEIRACLPSLREKTRGFDRIVSLGAQSSRALTMAGISHFKMPHPSGACRFWNDKEAGALKVRSLRDYLSEAIS